MIAINTSNLEKEMRRIGIERKDVAELIGVTYRTVHDRFNGNSEWKYTDCVLIRDTYFPDKRLEDLFSYIQKD